MNNLVEKRFLDKNPVTLAWNLSSRAKRLNQLDQAKARQPATLISEDQIRPATNPKNLAAHLTIKRIAGLVLILALAVAIFEFIKWLF